MMHGQKNIKLCKTELRLWWESCRNCKYCDIIEVSLHLDDGKSLPWGFFNGVCGSLSIHWVKE